MEINMPPEEGGDIHPSPNGKEEGPRLTARVLSHPWLVLMTITLIVVMLVGINSGAAYATSIGLTLPIPALMFWAVVQVMNWVHHTIFRNRLRLMLATLATAVILISVYGPTGFWHQVQHGMGHVAIGIANLWTNPDSPPPQGEGAEDKRVMNQEDAGEQPHLHPDFGRSITATPIGHEEAYDFPD